MVRFDYECRKGHQFTLWNTEGLLCPLCGSKRIKKIFLTPTAISTGSAAKIDKLAERQLEAAGLSNFTNAGGSIRRTRKTDPKALEAVAVAKAHNIPIPPTGPQTGLEANIERMRAQFRGLGAEGYIKAAGGKGKTVVTQNPRGPGALVNGIVQRARQTIPLATMGQRITSPNAKEESAKLKSLLGK